MTPTQRSTVLVVERFLAAVEAYSRAAAEFSETVRAVQTCRPPQPSRR